MVGQRRQVIHNLHSVQYSVRFRSTEYGVTIGCIGRNKRAWHPPCQGARRPPATPACPPAGLWPALLRSLHQLRSSQLPTTNTLGLQRLSTQHQPSLFSDSHHHSTPAAAFIACCSAEVALRRSIQSSVVTLSATAVPLPTPPPSEPYSPTRGPLSLLPSLSPHRYST